LTRLRKIKSQLFKKSCPKCKLIFLSPHKDKIYCSSKCRDKLKHKRYSERSPQRSRCSRKRRRKNMLSALLSKHGSICWYCSVELTDVIHIDHVIPKSSGGSNSIENRALTCTMCNHAKHIYSLDTFKGWLNHIKSANFKCLL